MSRRKFNEDVKRLINEFGIKQSVIISEIGSNRVTFPQKLAENTFTSQEQEKILSKWGNLIK